MLVVDFFQWWYVKGWLQRISLLTEHVTNTADYFSVNILFKTLFSPWRQIVTATRADQSLDTKYQALIDNLLSRFVGFFVRLFVLIAALITVIFTLVFNLVILIIWPAIPLLPLVVIILGTSV